ncbi:MAG TPA: biotin carboxylase N-terminal domain-containing protein [Streptosporangiaceae bacterium]|nr:biotin carboxylase N-terminal domain-containing protein [Streptosporangiaceae bacterium]
MIRRVLVANRGEIARRIFRTCREAGIGCVAVFSDPDAGAPHVAEADAAVPLPGARPADTYLNGPAIVAAAVAAGADAVHPGYGFLSEDAAFARAVHAAGLTWIGPPADAIEAMGSKITSKKLAAEAGVPVLPELAAGEITDYPVLVKASAGGGGRGMRVVRGPGGLQAALESARREAQASFGDGTVFCEPLLAAARHVEVQVLADAHGTIWALTERDCSVQRRYQKVIEETPSPAVDPPLRERLLAAAAAVTAAVGYLGAGTAEFLVAADGRFFFLEFNTRLQVEHPVTECVHGLDLVALQLDIAQGAALPSRPPAPAGHAIEARLYAEDPADGYRPATGRVWSLDVPGVVARSGPPAAGGAARGLRLDSGVEAGSEVSPHYDSMLAKLIAWAPDRPGAARLLAAALDRARIHGPATNRALLAGVLRDPMFLAGRADTSLLDGYDLAGLTPPDETIRLSATAAALAGAAANRAAARAVPGLPAAWRNVASQPQRMAYDGPRGRVEADYVWRRDGLAATPGDGAAAVTVIAVAADHVLLESGGVRYRFDVTGYGDVVWVDSVFGSVALTPVPRLPEPAASVRPGSLVAPMPGSVVRIEASAGQRVSAGQPVLVLEAMKMEHLIVAPGDGLLAEVLVARGDQVAAGDVLATVTGEDSQ